MPFNYNKDFNTVDTLKPFRHWCQKVLPAVYDDSLSYYELLCKVVDYLNKTMENVNELNENFQMLKEVFDKLVEYVNEFEEDVLNRLSAQDAKIKAMEDKIDAFIVEMNNKFADFEQRMTDYIEQYTAEYVQTAFTTYVEGDEFSNVLDIKVENALGGSGINDKLDGINTDTAEILKRIGTTGETGGSSASGTVMSKLNALISVGGSGGGGSSAEINVESLVANIGDTTDSGATNESGTVFGKLNKIIDNTAGTSEGEQKTNESIGGTADTGGTSESGTIFAKLNKLISDATNLLTNTETNNNGSETGTLSQKLSSIINYVKTNNTSSDSGTLSQKLSSIINYVKTDNTASSTGTLSQKLSYIISNSGGGGSLYKKEMFGNTTFNETIRVNGYVYFKLSDTTSNSIQNLKITIDNTEFDFAEEYYHVNTQNVWLCYGLTGSATLQNKNELKLGVLNQTVYAPSNSAGYTALTTPVYVNGDIVVSFSAGRSSDGVTLYVFK